MSKDLKESVSLTMHLWSNSIKDQHFVLSAAEQPSVAVKVLAVQQHQDCIQDCIEDWTCK